MISSRVSVGNLDTSMVSIRSSIAKRSACVPAVVASAPSLCRRRCAVQHDEPGETDPDGGLFGLEEIRQKDALWSIRINDQWRFCFRWEDRDAYDVEVTDYH